jgi:hypothetical protein
MMLMMPLQPLAEDDDATSALESLLKVMMILFQL